MTKPPRVRGVYAEPVNEDDAYRKAVTEWRKVERLSHRQQSQEIVFHESPVCLVFAADLHLGSNGVDYPRIFHEAETVVKTPGMYLCLVGDLLDNFIVPKLMAARHSAVITVEEEWGLVRKYLNLVAPKLLVSVAGNHERFDWVLSAVDYFRETLRNIKPSCLYDANDVLLNLRVGKALFPMRLRHKWRGTSLWNSTHGLERAAHLDGDGIGGVLVGAHTHQSGLAREYNAQGKTGIAILCGSYKIHDPYQREQGFPKSNTSTAMSVIFFEDGTMFAVPYVDRAAWLMRKLRGKE